MKLLVPYHGNYSNIFFLLTFLVSLNFTLYFFFYNLSNLKNICIFFVFFVFGSNLFRGELDGVVLLMADTIPPMGKTHQSAKAPLMFEPMMPL